VISDDVRWLREEAERLRGALRLIPDFVPHSLRRHYPELADRYDRLADAIDQLGAK
jgi:DICT domain-containing protein